MLSFLKSVLASAVGTLLAFVGAGFLLVVALVGLIGSAGDGYQRVVAVTPQSMLLIGGDLAINDTPEHGAPGIDQLLFGVAGPQLDLLRALEAIDLAAKDERIAGILLSGNLIAGHVQKAELRQAIAAFKQTSGKPVLAWIENGSQMEYYLSSVADKVYLHTSGELEFKGLAGFGPYFGETLQLVGLGVQVTKVGKYKSAVEPYLGGAMSPEAREQEAAMLDGIWKRLLGEVARSRGLTPAELTRAVDSAGVFPARRAVALKLADAALHRDEFVGVVRAAGAGVDDSGTSFRKIGLHRYAQKVVLPARGPGIAIVYAEGEIVDGWGGLADIGGDRLARDLRDIRGADRFKAVVLRVNSPGGSAFASDVVAREVGLLKAKGIPVVVSMGDVAASGGYYIAAKASLVMADRSTITGSIGVFGLLLNYEELAKKVRLGTDGVKTGRFADLLSGHRAATPQELAIVQASVDGVYEDFLRIVAEGRGMTRDSVHDIAQGRVWLGEDARGLRLVDKLGGLRDAIKEAQSLAKLDQAEWVQFPGLHEGRETFWQQLLSDEEDSPLFVKASTDPARDFLKANARWLRSLRALNDPKGVYLTCPLTLPRR